MTHEVDDAHERPLGTDDLLAEGLAIGLSHKAAAERAGLSAKTIQRRLADPSFASLVEARRTVHVQAACDRLVALAGSATDVLLAALGNDDPLVGLRAVDLILRHMVAVRRHVDLERRIAELLQSPLGSSKA